MNSIIDYLFKLFTKTTDYYNVYKAKGRKYGTSSQIYHAKAIINQTPFFDIVSRKRPTITLNPNNKYVAWGWADFFTPEDPQINLALCAKYDFQSTFYRQIKPKTGDYLNTVSYNRDELKMIEKQGSYNGNHGYLHINYIYTCPLYDGRTTPSANDLRVSRSDGTNELGHLVTKTVDESITSTIRSSWLRLSSTLGAKVWKDLSDNDCADITKSLGAFGMPIDGQNGQKVLEGLDILSARYCGTTSTSVLNGDYTARVPNTAGGVSPDNEHRILGGIFQGSATTQNHEIWERILIIEQSYKAEFEGMLRNHTFWGVPGGGTRFLRYNIENPPDVYGAYIDKDHNQLSCGAAVISSSITGTSRSWIDCLRSSGYKATMSNQGSGYATFEADKLSRLECQRIYQRNLSYKKNDNVGDGFTYALRQFMPSFTEADVDAALASDDVVKYLYDLCATDARFTSITAYSPANLFAHINEMTKLISWGLIPDCVDDSGTAGNLINRSSLALGSEALMQYCLRAGISIISHEQAFEVAKNFTYAPNNYFPNPIFVTTQKTLLLSDNAPSYPDGWNGGSLSNGVLSFSVGTFFTRQYGIIPGELSLSIQAIGDGTIKLKKIRNKHTYSGTSGAEFEDWISISVNNATTQEVTATGTIENADMITYATPTTPQERAFQNYMGGFDDKVCGIHIEIVVATGKTLAISSPIITIS